MEVGFLPPQNNSNGVCDASKNAAISGSASSASLSSSRIIETKVAAAAST
jgi:hypothetical protein